MSDSKWYFTEEQLANSPSRKCGINAEIELSYRQRAANLIQEMGQRLQVSQLCINTAIVYMHRFYAFHAFTMFHRNSIAAAAFFLAAKVEEQPRKLEHVIKILNICLEKTDITRETYAEQAQELVFNENILLQTLGFDVAIDHPHTHVVKACQLFNIVTVSRELRQTCYFMASNSLHLTTMCLKYRPTVVAAFCIYIACKWSRWEIPNSSEGKAWYSYVDDTVTLDTLKKLTEEYLQILERSPSKFKSKMKAITSNGQAGVNQTPGIGSEGPSASHHKNQHHHHHHHRNNSSSSATTSINNSNGSSRKQLPSNETNPASSSSSSSKAQLHQQLSNASYKQSVSSQPGMNTSLPPTSSSSIASTAHNMHRHRASATQQAYTSSSTSNPQKQALLDERLQQQQQQQQRILQPDGSQYYNPAGPPNPRITEHNKHRMSSSSVPQMSQQQQQQQQQQQLQQQSQQQQQHQQHLQTYLKPTMNDQKQHNIVPPNNNSKQSYSMDLHQKNMKPMDYHNRSNAMSHMQQPMQANPQQKKPQPWQPTQQPQQMQPQQLSQNQDKLQYPHLQKNLQMSNSSLSDHSSSNLMNHKPSLQALSAYNDVKPTSNASQNDFWFNDKINEMPSKLLSTPPRLAKSLFSPSPEQDSSEKSKYMMMTGNLKRENVAVDSPKEDRKTPTKREREKLLASNASQKLNQQQQQQMSSQSLDKKFKTDSMLDTHGNLLSVGNIDSQNKKRSYSSLKDSVDNNNHGRENKIRKVEQNRLDMGTQGSIPISSSQAQMMSATSRLNHQQMPPFPPQQQQSQMYGVLDQNPITPANTKQPIETNPEIVKSLLKECIPSSSKFDSYDTDSPLDVINPEPPEELLAPIPSMHHHQQQQSLQAMKREVNDDLADESKTDILDSSAGEGRSKDHKKKSKKKKEKHKHKKKHKSSDREDKSPPMKIILSKDKHDARSSPEGNASGCLKIKIPIKDVSKSDITQNNQTQAPLKLKISKGSYSNLSNNTTTTSSSSTSSSAHKKKDKDRDKSKSKSSKHNLSDFKETGYQHA